MAALVAAILLTLGVSAICSLLEAVLLSTTAADIEDLKRTKRKAGLLMEEFKRDMEFSSSAVLALNTIANTLGAALVGGLSLKVFGEDNLLYFSIGMTLGILFFSEVIPKNIGIFYRRYWVKYLVYPLYCVRLIMLPIARLCKRAVQLLLPAGSLAVTDHSQEIHLLAEKGAKEGSLGKDERDIILNALRLNTILLETIMTPRRVVFALNKDQTLAQVLTQYGNLPFARIPIFEGNLDNIVGIVRRRDLLQADEKEALESCLQPVYFIPETATGADALQLFLKKQQQLLVVVDEFGTTSGVITMEDVIEHILGKEIFEKDDVAVDMRKLAMQHKEESEEL